MSLDPESPSPSPSTSRDWFFPSPSSSPLTLPLPPTTNRDWFFPSPAPSFARSSHLSKTPTRRFSTYPRLPKPYSPDTNRPTTSSQSTSSLPHQDYPKYAGIRRRIDFPRRAGRSSSSTPDDDGVVSGRNSDKCDVLEEKPSEKVTGFAGLRLKIRWQMAFSVAVSSHSFTLSIFR